MIAANTKIEAMSPNKSLFQGKFFMVVRKSTLVLFA